MLEEALYTDLGDISVDYSNVLAVNKLWKTPFDHAVPAWWRAPDSVRFGVASDNTEKFLNVQSIVMQHSMHDVVHASASEDNIQSFLRHDVHGDTKIHADYIAPEAIASNFVSATAIYKALSGCLDDIPATHVFGFDTDIVALNQPMYEPFGKPNGIDEFMTMLQVISGNFLTIHTAGALARIADRRVVAFDVATVFLKLRKFSPFEFIDTVGKQNVGRSSGGIDFSDQKVMSFIDPSVPVRINRMDDLPPEKHRQYALREVRLSSIKAPAAMHEIVRGAPPEMIRWLLYNGINNPTLFSPLAFES